MQVTIKTPAVLDTAKDAKTTDTKAMFANLIQEQSQLEKKPCCIQD